MAKAEKASSGPSEPQHNGLLILFALIALYVLYCHYMHPLVLQAQAWVVLNEWKIIACLVAFLISAVVAGFVLLWNAWTRKRAIAAITEEDSESVYLGKDLDTDEEVHLKAEFRPMHTQANGTTNAGKTASITTPWSASDIEHGRGMIIIDGKSDRHFLEQLYARVVQEGREKDFMVLSLAQPAISSTFNPFCAGTPEQITERFFSTLTFTEEYYRAIQFSALRTLIALLMHRGEIPMPGVLRELLRSREKLLAWAGSVTDPNLAADVRALGEESAEDFTNRYSGLVTALGHYSQGATAALFNSRYPEINFTQIIKNRKICYFQLPTLQFPFLGEATGKLVLQCLQSAISELQVTGENPKGLFSIYLDDFNDYIYPGFASLLNKARSAKIGVVFSHQSIGDLKKVSPEFKEIVMTNTNIKILMRSNDPDSADHFARMIGTKTTEKSTERRTRLSFGRKEMTGEESVRETESFIVHPNIFKSKLGTGQGIVVIPYPQGQIVKRVQFAMVPDLPRLNLPMRSLSTPNFSTEATAPSDPKLKTNKPGRSTPGSSETKNAKQPNP